MAAEDWKQVLNRLSEGDYQAFAKVSRLVTNALHARRAYDFRDEWDDLIQEVMLIVIEAHRGGKIRNQQALPSFVHETTKNVFLRRIEKLKRLEYVEASEQDSAEPQWARPKTTLEEREVREHMARLPEPQRAALMEIYVLGRTYPEAARATNTPLGTFKRRLREGLDELMRRTAPHDKGAEQPGPEEPTTELARTGTDAGEPATEAGPDESKKKEGP